MFFLLQCHPLFLKKHDNDTAWNVFQKCFVHHNNSLQVSSPSVLQEHYSVLQVYQWLVGYWSYFNFWRFTQVCSVKISSALGLFPYMSLGRWCTLKGFLSLRCLLCHTLGWPSHLFVVSHYHFEWLASPLR